MTTTKKTIAQTTIPSNSNQAASPATTAAAPSTTPSTASPPTTPVNANDTFATYVAQAVAALSAMEQQLGSDPPLTAVQKRHAARLRRGGASVVAQVASLAQQNGLKSSSLQASTMCRFSASRRHSRRSPPASRRS